MNNSQDTLYLCDWLPPDFGAVGQYSLLFAKERAVSGENVTIVGLSSLKTSVGGEKIGKGSLTVIRLKAKAYNKTSFIDRARWTFMTNMRLIWKARNAYLSSQTVIFTGSPPFMLLLLAPLNLLFRKKLIYRITDFYPEILMAGQKSVPAIVSTLFLFTKFWRRRIQQFEVLGEDQKKKLLEMGISEKAITVKRDPSPVSISSNTQALPRPKELENKKILLYSGNFGAAHDFETFLYGYKEHHKKDGSVVLWLNATGVNADRLEEELKANFLPYYRTKPVALEHLASLLVTPDAHLITLKDPFVGLVVPSKVYGCIASQKQIIYIGSEDSDVHLLCCEKIPNNHYHRIPVGNSQAVARALSKLGMDNREAPSIPAVSPRSRITA